MASPSARPSPAGALIGTAAIALAAALWAASAVVAKSLFQDGMPAIQLSEARSFIAFTGFALIHAARRARQAGQSGPEPEVSARRVWRQLVAIGVAIALVNAAYYIAIDRLQVAVAIVIQYTAPAMVVTWVAITLRRVPSMKTIIAVVAATIGVALAAELTEADLGGLDPRGLLAASGSALFFAAYSLISEKVSASLGPLRTMLWAFGAASAFWICYQAPQGWPRQLTAPDNIARVLVVGVVGTLLPFLLYVWGIHRVSAEKAVIAATLEPPLAALAAWIWLDQSLSAIQLAGGALVLIAIATLQSQRIVTPTRTQPS